MKIIVTTAVPPELGRDDVTHITSVDQAALKQLAADVGVLAAHGVTMSTRPSTKNILREIADRWSEPQ